MKESLDSRFLKHSCVVCSTVNSSGVWFVWHGPKLVEMAVKAISHTMSNSTTHTPQTAGIQQLQKRPQHDSSAAWALLITEDLCELWLTQCCGSVYFTTVAILSLIFKKRNTWFYICFLNVKSNSLPWPQLSGHVEMALSHGIFELQLSSRPTQFTLFNLSGDSLLV